ncbi:CaiB/BaiF CoA-transferase family protein [Niveispirillum sp.]|uniref:CaiB/BaiF CoA transferase family protein n=1 Tax=Niveispirillum sp. TaxID=1917217 RepID=UPI001B6E33D2|nr:CaiB/BaiF CoA-transferase family protein [Niveispirillum sp.]MBP7336273.1 CoA transferase [Niveispirillum sp.]
MFDLLKGVRVLEFGILLNGDLLGMLLSDLGAEVIKVEEPVKGDYIRDMLGIITPHHSPAHLQVNKNKKSVTINVNTPEGKHAFFELLKTVDIFADGLRGGACEAMGIGYEAQKAVKPDIIYMANTGFGMTGPYARLGAHGYSMLAIVGGLPAKKDADGFVDRCGNEGDLFGGIKGGPGGPYAVMAGLAALWRRQQTGQGAYIDVAASDANLATSWMAAVTNLNYDRITDLTGMAPRGTPNDGWPAGSILYALYEAKDGRFIMFCAIEPKFWYNFCDAIGRADLRDVIRTDIPVDYGIDKPWLRAVLAEIFRERDANEWMRIALEKNVPLAVANTLDQVPTDPHNRARGILFDGDHPRAGPFTYVRYPAIIDGQHSGVEIPAPLLGEHTNDVLAAIGLSAAEIAAAQVTPPRKRKDPV